MSHEGNTADNLAKIMRNIMVCTGYLMKINYHNKRQRSEYLWVTVPCFGGKLNLLRDGFVAKFSSDQRDNLTAFRVCFRFRFLPKPPLISLLEQQ